MTKIDAASARPSGTLQHYGKPLREMTGRYRARNPILVSALAFFDLLGLLHPKRKGRIPLNRPIRLLIANWAHLGDVVAILPLLEFLAKHPRIGRLGVLIGSWSQCIVSELPFIDNIHCLDHFILDRGEGSQFEKMRRYFTRQGEVVAELINCNYDASIDLFPVFPTTHRLAWKAGIPTRIGFSSGGFGPYLTNSISWPTDDEYILTRQMRLLEPLLGSEIPETLSAAYPGFTPADLTELELTPDRKYVLLHIGVGDYRSWPIPKWLELGNALQKQGREIVFTGAKGVETEIAGEVARALGARSIAGRLSWNEFVTAVSNAAVVISVDTVTGHLAACFGIPSIVLLSGRWGKKFFRPNNVNAITLTHPVGCAPCYRSTGCVTMACVKLICASDVLSVFNRIANVNVAAAL